MNLGIYFLMLVNLFSLKERGPYVSALQFNKNNKDSVRFFWDKFNSLLQNKDIDGLCPLVEFPIFVECLMDQEKGDTLNIQNFVLKYDKIFDDTVIDTFAHIRIEDVLSTSQKSKAKNSENNFEIYVGYKEWGNDSQMTHEYGRIFSFCIIEGKWKLCRVRCIG